MEELSWTERRPKKEVKSFWHLVLSRMFDVTKLWIPCWYYNLVLMEKLYAKQPELAGSPGKAWVGTKADGSRMIWRRLAIGYVGYVLWI